ncbi:MAG: DUF4234 domain-containing protein [Acidimicrobiales bacterium]|nr:DUF4234 domain-containing protein [Acidimicrobiales bacterium]
MSDDAPGPPSDPTPPEGAPPPPPQGDAPPPPAAGQQSGGYPPPAGYGQPGGVVPPEIGGVFYSTGLVILLTIVTCGVWGAVWSYRTGEDLKNYNREGLGGVVTLVVALLLSPVIMFTIPNEIEKMYQRDGRQSPVTTLWGLWFLLPLIGPIVWYVKVQQALNDFWLSKGARQV